MRLLKGFVATLLLAVIAGGWFGYQFLWGKPYSIHHFADRGLLKWLWEKPEFLTYLGIIENTPLDFHSHRLSDVSPESMSRIARNTENEYRIFQSYDTSDMDEQELLTHTYLEWSLGSSVVAHRFPYHLDMVLYVGPYPANQLDGLHTFPLGIIGRMQQVIDGESAQRYLERVAALPDFIDSLIAAVRARQAMNANPPLIVLDKTLSQIQGLTSTPAENWDIHTTLLTHLDALDIDSSDKAVLAAENLSLIKHKVIPAYTKLGNTLEGIRPDAPQDVGVWALPNGDDYYQSLLYAQTSVRMTPDEIHSLGLKLVTELDRELDAALAELGYTSGSVADRIGEMKDEPGARYTNDDAGRAQIIADFTRIGQELEAATTELFRKRAGTEVVVERIPEFQEDGAMFAYYDAPSLDGSRPGRFMINLRTPHELEKYGMRTLSAHESVPGHHFETSLSQQLEGIPLLRRDAYLPSYSEGWALYAEHLVYEQGLHDSRSNLGRLQARMLRATRLVVDTGIHAKRWSRQRAIDYMIAHTGMPEQEVQAEIDRYIVLPGQACAYMLGMQAILEAREDAKRRQGERFDLAKFNDAVLANGPLPIEALQQQLERALPQTLSTGGRSLK